MSDYAVCGCYNNDGHDDGDVGDGHDAVDYEFDIHRVLRHLCDNGGDGGWLVS